MKENIVNTPLGIQTLFQAIVPLIIMGGLIGVYLPIKKVVLTKNGFLVTNYRRKLYIPFEQVKSVHGSILLSPEVILLRVEGSGFGKNILFIPKYRFTILAPFTINPVVNELRDIITN
ncbi:hypothetical protein [Photobacterium kasasachensis]|uniref:hypothetical protein n=1 Tax=Photobacterium kasasachensis TaxID=2910240 RepID=UPI003D13C64B